MNTIRAPARYSHSGLCVSDLKKAQDFYVNVLGFQQGMTNHIGAEYSKLLGVERNLDLTASMLRLGGLTLELLAFRNPTPIGSREPRPMYQFGLAHLSLNVDDISVTLAVVEQWGGKILHESRAKFQLPGNEGEIVFITDPDGTRIELMSFPTDPQLG